MLLPRMAFNYEKVRTSQRHWRQLQRRTRRRRALITLDSRREVCGLGRLEVVARKLLLLLDTDPRRDPGADVERSLPGPCGVRGIMAACGHRLGFEKRRLSKLVVPMLMFVDVRAGPGARHLVLLQLAGALGCTWKQAQGYLHPCKYCGDTSSKPNCRSFLDHVGEESLYGVNQQTSSTSDEQRIDSNCYIHSIYG